MELEQYNAQGDGPFSADDLDVLEQNRRLKRLLVNQLTANGTKLPDEKSDKQLVAQLLDSLDSEVLSRTRVKVAAKTEQAITDLGGAVERALLKHRSPVMIPGRAQVTVLPAEIQLGETVPGEMDQGVINLSVADLILAHQ